MAKQLKAQAVIEEASRWLGVKEVGNNGGFDNAEFQSLMVDVGWKKGEAWCISAAKAWWLEVFKDDAVIHAEIKRIISKSCMKSWQAVTQSSIIRKTNEIVEGGIFIYSAGEGKGHAGIVTKKLDDFKMRTVEGNTNIAGGREGDSIMSRVRDVNKKNATQRRNWNFMGTIYIPALEQDNAGNPQ